MDKTDTENADPVRSRIIIKTIVIILMISGLLVLMQMVDFESFFKSLPFGSAENAHWLNGKAAFIVLGSLLVCIGCPRQVVSFFAAYFFGLWAGVLIGLTATTLGCLISFSVARLFQGYFKNLVRGKLNLALQFWKDNTFTVTLIWRFIPAGSNLLTNLAAGALGISALPFIAGSALGYIPHTVIFAILGSGVELGSSVQIYLSIGLFTVCVMLGLMLFSKYKKDMNAGV